MVPEPVKALPDLGELATDDIIADCVQLGSSIYRSRQIPDALRNEPDLVGQLLLALGQCHDRLDEAAARILLPPKTVASLNGEPNDGDAAGNRADGGEDFGG